MSWHNTLGKIIFVNVSYLESVPSSWHEIRLSPLGRAAQGWYGDTSWGSDSGLTAWPQCSQAHQFWCEGDPHPVLCFTSWCLQSKKSSRKQDSQRLCYFNRIQNYLCVMKGAVKQFCVRTWSSPMTSYPGIHTKGKTTMHFLQSNPRNSVAVWVCHDPNPGLFDKCAEVLNPSNPPETRIIKSVLWGVVPGYSALWLFVAD